VVPCHWRTGGPITLASDTLSRQYAADSARENSANVRCLTGCLSGAYVPELDSTARTYDQKTPSSTGWKAPHGQAHVAFQPVAVAFEAGDLGVVDEPVDHGGDDGVAEDFAPAAEGIVHGPAEQLPAPCQAHCH
jgi:hypothetical protein